MKTDLQIAKEAKIKNIDEILNYINLEDSDVEKYGNYMAKINTNVQKKLKKKPVGKYIDVTAVTPTPLGEGKTTITIGLGMALNRIGKKAIIAIRQPSMGPTFGIKGGAAGGGYSQVIPMEEFNLHLTGDIHAISVAHNLVAAMLDNHLVKGNKLNIDINRIVWNRVVDVSDRALRHIKIGIGKESVYGVERDTRFDITVASELMAILALTTDLQDFRKRVGRVVIAYNKDGDPITIEDIKAAGAVTVLMKNTLKPTLVQTLDNTPALIHAGPFANIAHGNSSIIADQIGVRLGEYLVTESGFGADIGMEKFMNIKSRYSGLKPDAVVLVASVRAIKWHSGNFSKLAKTDRISALQEEDIQSLEKGVGNLIKQIENVKSYGIPVVVAVNKFETDTIAEVNYLIKKAKESGAFDAVETTVFANGSKGGEVLAHAVVRASNQKSDFKFLYKLNIPVKEKINAIATKMYGASSINYSKKANKQIQNIEKNNFGDLPICMAKTHLSLSDNPKLLGRPKDFKVLVREVNVSVGAGFIYPLLGEMRTMPGLPTHPNAENIDIDENGEVVGLS